MSDSYTYSALGAANGVQSTEAERNALFLKLFAGEVLTAFERTTIMKDKHRIRTTGGGKKSESFPVTGRADAEYHDPGTEIVGAVQKANERVITITRPLISHVFVDSWDEMVNHYDLRSIYTGNLGEALGFTFDTHVQRELILAARGSAVVDGLPGGSSIANDLFKLSANGGTDGGAVSEAAKAAAIADAIFTAAQTFDTNYIPKERFCMLRPAEYYCLVKAVQTNGFSAICGDYGGQGSYADGKIIKIAGVTILASPTLPRTNVSQGASTSKDRYVYGDFSKTIGVVFTKDAVGTCMLKNIAIETDYQVERQGTLVVAKYACGHGILRPECAIELKLSSLSN